MYRVGLARASTGTADRLSATEMTSMGCDETLRGVFRSGVSCTAALLAALLAVPVAVGQEASPLDLSKGEAPTDFVDALASGKVSLNVRARSEWADVRGFEDSWANTIRTRLGYQTQKYEGFQAYLELEDVTAIDDDAYNSTLNNEPEKSVIADPETTELNQVWASYDVPIDDLKLAIKGGRQVINLDDQRFIGSVGWRQDDQTFEAVQLTSDFGVKGLSAMYAYLWEINRIFAEAGDWDSDSHVINVGYDIKDLGKLTGFAYLLDFDDSSPLNSSQTYGVRLAGKKPIDEQFSVEYAGSFAWQQDYGDNPVDYDAMYYALDAGLAVKDIGTFGAGYEVLGSDDGDFAFRMPLATGHKFNGFADVFLITPNDGLKDLYVYFKPANLPWQLNGMIGYHRFSGNEDIKQYGTEIDAVLTKKISDNLSVGAKYAYFMTDEPGFAERTRVTLDLTFSF